MKKRKIALRHAVCRALSDEHSHWFFPVNNTIALVIVASTLVVILETVPSFGATYGHVFVYAEYVFLTIFSFEYMLRVWSAPKPLRYMSSFFGIIDLVAILPGIFLIAAPGAVTYHTLGVLRILRVLRLLRTIRLVRFIIPKRQRERIAEHLKNGTSLINVQIYAFALACVVILAGTLMYVAEGQIPDTKFTSIPVGMWWALVTVSTVGYGDLVPVTTIGKMVGSLTIFLGLGLFVLLLTVVGQTLQIVLFGSSIEEKR